VPIEELGIGLLGAIARFIGWVVLKSVTFGKYPIRESSQEIVIAVGVFTLLIPVIAFTIYVS